MWYNFAPISEAEPCQGVKENNLSIWTLPARAFRADAISSGNGQPFDGVWYTIMVVASDIPYSARIEHVKFNETVLRIWKQRNYLYRLSSLSITQMHKAIALKRHTHMLKTHKWTEENVCFHTKNWCARAWYFREGGRRKQRTENDAISSDCNSEHSQTHIASLPHFPTNIHTHRTLPIN